MANALREALSHMNQSSAESKKNPTNGMQEDDSNAEEHIGGGKLHSVHTNMHHDGTYSVHAHHADGKHAATHHGTDHEAAIAKHAEHVRAHHAAAHGKEIRD